jgi:hypothetical protein
MESNTVVLKLERYHELLSFEKKLGYEKNHTIYVKKDFYGSEQVCTDDESVKLLAEELKESLEKQAILYREIDQLKKLKPKEKNFFKCMKLFF